jgi:hypothetical protein
MKIRFLRNCALGGVHQAVGTIVDVDRPTAMTLILHRRAEAVEEKSASEIQQRDPDTDTRDPQIDEPSKRGRKAKTNG